MIEIPQFETTKELHKFLHENKDRLIAQKKAITKEADGFAFSHKISTNKSIEGVNKANEPIENPPETLAVKAIINTTNLLDSHMDVHIPGIWDKSLQENKMIMHLQEHQMKFDKVIADSSDLQAFTWTYGWAELGFSEFEGQTQALVFDSNVKQDRNPFMHEQYAKGRVKNHSVGMRYVKLILCMNDEEYGAEFEAWEKYYPAIVNPEVADKKGYFWAVTEAKVIEGSAVLLGSNFATPTLDNNGESKTTPKAEPGKTTQELEPEKKGFDVKSYLY